MPAEKDDCCRVVPWDCSNSRIDDVRQVQTRQDLLDKLAAELALHEAVGCDQPDEARRPGITGQRQLEEAFGER